MGAIFDQHDYDVTLELSQPDLGYIQAGNRVPQLV